MPSPYPCSQSKAIQIALNAPTITPTNGYKIKWRVYGSSTWNIVPNQNGPTITILSVPSCYDLEVSLQADCGNGAVGTETIVPVAGLSTSCYTYLIGANGQYQYTPCGEVNAVIVDALQGANICAVQNTVLALDGGNFSSSGMCNL